MFLCHDKEDHLHLTVQTERITTFLDVPGAKEDGLVTIAEVAESYTISKNHLMKAAHQLGVAGYIEPFGAPR